VTTEPGPSHDRLGDDAVYAACVSRVVDGNEADASFLRALIDRIGDQQSFADLIAPTVDGELISTELRTLGAGPVEIQSIDGHDLRTDVDVTAADDVTARIVFARDGSGLLTWLHVYVKPPSFPGVAGGRIIVVNGPSGSGKSTLMVGLQSVAPFPLVVLDEPEHVGTVQPGYLIWRDTAPALHRGYLAAIRALAGEGNHVALSAAGHGHAEIAEAFAGVPMVRIGLHCDVDVLVDRERRTGRWAGIAHQSLTVHDGWTYDLEFDTTHGPDPRELAERVLELVRT
jgi:chloramphenicol 3-O-phosphotransferase